MNFKQDVERMTEKLANLKNALTTHNPGHNYYDGGNFITAEFKDMYAAAKFAEDFEEDFDITTARDSTFGYLAHPTSLIFTYR